MAKTSGKKPTRLPSKDELVAFIGEQPGKVGTPLDFEILPAALRVRISARHPGVSPSGLLP